MSLETIEMLLPLAHSQYYSYNNNRVRCLSRPWRCPPPLSTYSNNKVIIMIGSDVPRVFGETPLPTHCLCLEVFQVGCQMQ